MNSTVSIRQICVRDTLNCLALACGAALIIGFMSRLGPGNAFGYIGDVLIITAFAQGALSWLAQVCGDLDMAENTILGSVSSITTAGILLVLNWVV
jgi:hypothetical protein